jgi:type I restriction enzyme S subunit
MDEIVEKPLKEIGCSLLSGFAFKSSDYASNGIPVIKIGNIQNRIVTVDINGDYVSEELIDDKTIKFLLNNSDILIAMTGQGSVGRVGKLKLRNNQKAFLNQRVGKFLCDEVGINKDYLYYILTTNKFQDYLFNTGAGSGQPNLSPELILQTEIPWVEYKEQAAIASILSSLDNKIDLLHRQNATLEKMAETLFRQWFVEEAKEDWEEKTLGEMLTITSSKRIFYSEYVSSGVPFYRSKEIIDLRNNGSTSSELYISNERFHEINLKFGSPKEGDILMTSVGTLGVAYRIKANEKFYFKDGNLTWFKDFKCLASSIIYLWLISKIGQDELASITIGSTQQALTIEGLKGISFKIPPKGSISIYQKQFDDIITKIDSNQIQIRTLTAMRDTLLPKLMSGEVRVKI